MNLIEELLSRGHILKPEGSGNYRVLGHGGLIVKDNGWYSHSQGIGGNAATLLGKIGFAYNNPNHLDPSNFDIPKSKPKISLDGELYPLGARSKLYLLRRHIHGDLIDELNERGTLREDRKGYICFVGYNGKNNVKCVSCRSIEPHLNVQKYERAGSCKHYSFSIPSDKSSDVVILCEGPIDALSIACLEEIKHHRGYFETTKIATCGAPSSHIALRVQRLHPKSIILAFDNDVAGDRMAEAVEYLLKYYNFEIIRTKPGNGKDPNEWLENHAKKLLMK